MTDTEARDVGARVRELRHLRRWTQTDFAKEAALSVSMVSMVERGQRRPSLPMLGRIAAAFQVHAGEIVGPLTPLATPLAPLEVARWRDVVLALVNADSAAAFLDAKEKARAMLGET